MAPLLELNDLTVTFPVKGGGIIRRTVGEVRAVNGVNLELDAGTTLGLVGESGSGKSSLARAVVGLQSPTSGEIRLNGERIDDLSARRRRAYSRDVQMVFQDPYASLNPRMTVRQILSVAWRIHPIVSRAAEPRALADLMDRVGLNPDYADRYPHQFSGGQRQRIGIARALALQPQLIVCDEAVSALDVSIRAQIINLLEDLQTQTGVAYLFIAHDLSVVEHLCQRVAVMYHGDIVELGTTAQVFDEPRHEYTRALLSAVPVTRPWRTAEKGIS